MNRDAFFRQRKHGIFVTVFSELFPYLCQRVSDFKILSQDLCFFFLEKIKSLIVNDVFSKSFLRFFISFYRKLVLARFQRLSSRLELSVFS